MTRHRPSRCHDCEARLVAQHVRWYIGEAFTGTTTVQVCPDCPTDGVFREVEDGLPVIREPVAAGAGGSR